MCIELVLFFFFDVQVVFGALLVCLFGGFCDVLVWFGFDDKRTSLLVLNIVAAAIWHVSEDFANILLVIVVHAAHVGFKVLIFVFFFFLRMLLVIIFTLFVQFAVPNFLDFLDLLLAEALPRSHLFALLYNLGFVLVTRAVAGCVIDGLLCDVAQLKCDLNNLAHVGAGSASTGVKLKELLSLKLLLHELFESGQVLLVKRLFKRVQNQDCLLVGHGAEWEVSDHIKHGLDNFTSKQVVQEGRFFD